MVYNIRYTYNTRIGIYLFIYTFIIYNINSTQSFRIRCCIFPFRKEVPKIKYSQFCFPVEWSKIPRIHGLSNLHSCNRNTMSARRIYRVVDMGNRYGSCCRIASTMWKYKDTVYILYIYILTRK